MVNGSGSAAPDLTSNGNFHTAEHGPRGKTGDGALSDAHSPQSLSAKAGSARSPGGMPQIIVAQISNVDESRESVGQSDARENRETNSRRAARVLRHLDTLDHLQTPGSYFLQLDTIPDDSLEFARLMGAVGTEGSYFHAYAFMDFLGPSDSVTREEIYAAVVRHAVPGGENDGQLITSGTASSVNVPVLGNLGHVTTYLEAETGSVFNITEPDHHFKNGFVQRQVVITNEGVFIRTIGVGNNTDFGHWFMNNWGYRMAFMGSTESIRDDLYRK